MAKYYFDFRPYLFLFILLTFLVTSAKPLYAQKIASLEKKLKALPKDTNRINILNNLAYLYFNEDPVKALNYGKQAKQLSETLKFDKGRTRAFNNMGVSYIVSGTYDKAIDQLMEGLRLADSIQNNYWLGIISLNIGLVHTHVKNYEEALKCYEQGVKYSKLAKDTTNIIILCNNIGYNYVLIKQYNKALPYLNKGLKLADKTQNEAKKGLIYSTLAIIYQNKGQHTRAEQTFFKSLALSEKTKDAYTMLGTYMDFIGFYLDTKNQKAALKHLKKAFKISKTIGAKSYEATLYELYARYAKIEKNFAKALEYKEKAIALKEKVFSIKKNHQIAQIRINHEQEKSRNKQVILRQQIALEKKSKETQIIISVASFIALVIIVVVAILLYNSNQRRQKTNQQLAIQKQEAEKQRDIITENTLEIQAAYDHLKQSQEEIASQRDELKEKNIKLSTYRQRIGKSIQAAQMIQSAVFPTEGSLDNYFPESFVLNKPKDVVSGDFYWVDTQANMTILVVADCTGHGVPGAFMSMVANTLLDNIIKVHKVLDPAEILTQLHKKTKKALRQETTKNNSGMDVAIVTFGTAANGHTEVTFSGAKRPLFYIVKNTRTLTEVKGTRKAIGGIQLSSKVYEKHHLTLPAGSLLYLGSDGLADQNNEERTKLGKTQLKELLETNAYLPLASQKQQIEATLQNHMKNTEQRDDILWLGIRV